MKKNSTPTVCVSLFLYLYYYKITMKQTTKPKSIYQSINELQLKQSTCKTTNRPNEKPIE